MTVGKGLAFLAAALAAVGVASFEPMAGVLIGMVAFFFVGLSN